MIDYVKMLKEFHEKYNHAVGQSTHLLQGDKYPSFPTELVVLREKLISEEAAEFRGWAYENYDTANSIPINIIEIADALADILYVVFGTAVSFGIPIDDVFAEVHRSNMTKSMDKNEYGKTTKGPNYEPPDLKFILYLEKS